ncbi:MAG: GNAT family N-acetyltransferase [Cyclobacteriaceae bacterium]|nr:GNAT family N-acetyltransferase [Cyclobacteriaceae bacterium]
MEVEYRYILKPLDRKYIKDILESTKVFYDYEIKIALEILDEYYQKEEQCGYYFILAEVEGKVIGYVNYGPVPCTQTSWDIYWIAVRKDIMSKGIGSELIAIAEERIRKMKGKNIWVETSARKDYLPTRTFYEKMKYAIAAELKDFYAPDDHKVIYHKAL